tara:strand:- start:826 stop:1686 length:861 start_codon:yes stop_codon:yes gene_type:complete
MTKGVIIFAHNNEGIDYVKLACATALMIRKNMSVDGITLVTDDTSLNYSLTDHESIAKYFFDEIVQYSNQKFTKKTYRDHIKSDKVLTFYNGDRCQAWDITNYDETIVIDADYLIQSDILNNCWGSEDSFMANKHITTINTLFPMQQPRINFQGIEQFWATAIYFKKDQDAKQIFDAWKMVKENHPYYKSLYDIPGKTFRNDFALSVALHITENSNIPSLPDSSLLTSYDEDDIIDIELNKIVLATRDNDREKFMPVKIEGRNVHVMNKFALINSVERIMETYAGE